MKELFAFSSGIAAREKCPKEVRYFRENQAFGEHLSLQQHWGWGACVEGCLTGCVIVKMSPVSFPLK